MNGQPTSSVRCSAYSDFSRILFVQARQQSYKCHGELHTTKFLLFQRAQCFLDLVSHFQSKSDGCRLTGHSALFFANECDIGFTPQEAISQGWMELLYVLEWYIYWWSSQPSNISSSAIKNPRLYMYVGSHQRQENTTKLDFYTYTTFYTRLIVRKFGYTNQAAACAPCSNHAMLASTML